MLTINRKHLFINFSENWFFSSDKDEEPSSLFNYYVYSDTQLPFSFFVKKIKTVLLDLTKTSDDLFSGFKKGTRYDIRKSLKEDEKSIAYDRKPSIQIINQFHNYYSEFAKQSNLNPSNIDKLILIDKQGNLIISKAMTSQDDVLCMHALITDGHTIRLLYSGSHFRGNDKNIRALIGRANRTLHWNELTEAKRDGHQLYDFGGISINGETESVDKFKKSFGGIETYKYNYFKLGVLSFIRKRYIN